MKAETRFKLVVLTLVNLGIYPGPQAVRKALGRGWRSPRSASAECPGGRTLNGRETRWRRELLTGLGWKERPFGHRHARFAWVKEVFIGASQITKLTDEIHYLRGRLAHERGIRIWEGQRRRG
jgi:hypothetical protein